MRAYANGAQVNRGDDMGGEGERRARGELAAMRGEAVRSTKQSAADAKQSGVREKDGARGNPTRDVGGGERDAVRVRGIQGGAVRVWLVGGKRSKRRRHEQLK